MVLLFPARRGISRIMEQDPVTAFAALAHPKRLQVLRLLIRAHPKAVPAGTIGEALAIRPSTLSGYLAQLLEAALITQDRHGTSLRYAVSLHGLEALSAAWLGEICRGLGLPDLGAPGPRVRNLLVLGAHNAGPTLCAEALLRAQAGERYEVFSAGVETCGTPDPALIRHLAQLGCEPDLLWSKPVADLTGQGAPRMDIVIALGARAWRDLPVFAGCPIVVPWALPPSLNAAALTDVISARLEAFIALDPATTARAGLHAALS